MTVCLLIAGVLLLLNAVVVTAAWRFLTKRTPRPPLARPLGAVLGAASGAWAACPEVLFLTDQVCDHFSRDSMCNASLPVPVLYVCPFALPLTSAVYAWLFAEVLGGRSHKALFTLAGAAAGAVLVTAAVFLPLVFSPRLERALPSWLSDALMLGVPVVGSLLGLAMAHRRQAKLAT